MLWDGRVWEGETSSVGAYSLSCKFIGKNQDLKWVLTGVYAPNDRGEKEEVWWEVGAA